jgi:cytochrome c oxidase subunit 2
MSIASPAENWYKPPIGSEKLWIGLALAWCLVMFFMMPYWHFKGKQNSTGEATRVTPAAFVERVQKFVASNKVGEENGIPVVEAYPGGEAYLLGRMWVWYPILKLKAGQTYRLHISSSDLQHGFSVQPINMNFQVLPGYDHVLTLTPTQKGEYTIVCNEFCGIGHHMMTGKIIVE